MSFYNWFKIPYDKPLGKEQEMWLLMNFGYLNFRTKDAVLVIAIFIILILTLLFRWSALEFVFSSC